MSIMDNGTRMEAIGTISIPTGHGALGLWGECWFLHVLRWPVDWLAACQSCW